MKAEQTNPILSVFYLNTINTSTQLNYGANLLATRLSLIDNSGNSAFNNVQGGTVDIRRVHAYALNGDIYTFSKNVTQGVVTPTEPGGTLVANTIYSFVLTQFNPYTGQNLSQLITYNTGANGAITTGSATTAWQTLINNYGFQVTMSGAGGQALTITAKAGYPQIFMTALFNITAGAATTGVESVGYTISGGLGDMNYLNEWGNTWASYNNYNSANTYDRCVLAFDDEKGQNYVTYIFINTGDANYGNSGSKFLKFWLNNILTMGGASPSSAYMQQASATENTNL